TVLAAGLGLLAAVVVGCGPAKELPEIVPTQRGSGQLSADPFGPAPAQSDPAAKAVLDRAVKAITGDDPKPLEKAQVSRGTAHGSRHLPNRAEPAEATRVTEAVWPDRARVEVQFKDTGTMTFRMRGNHGWVRAGPAEQEGDPVSIGHVMRTDMNAQHWLFL